MKGRKLRNLDELAQAVSLRRSVVVPGFGAFERPRPAAFVMNLQGRQLVKMFALGVFIWEPKKTTAIPFHKAVRAHGSKGRGGS